MSDWWDYKNETPVDLATVKKGEKYFYIPGPGQQTGEVEILSEEYVFGIRVKYIKSNEEDVIFEHQPNKKLYRLKTGGKKSRRNKRKTRKTRRRTNRRK